MSKENTGERIGTKARGFASMTSEKQREIARKGGRAAHEKGTAHEFTTDEARAAGRKGGERVSSNRSHMAEIGRLGGKSAAGRRARAASGSQQSQAANRPELSEQESSDLPQSQAQTNSNAQNVA